MVDIDPRADEIRRRDRLRLVDHFKRVYTIIVGLAITEACKKLWPVSWDSLHRPQLWMFAAFFVSIVPIFHGGDRSLDRKYGDTPTWGRRFGYIYDVYILLITAILFVGIAEAIPTSKDSSGGSYFYTFLGFVFIFDALALWIDFVKAPRAQRSQLRSYSLWIILNGVVWLSCWAAAFPASKWAEPRLAYGVSVAVFVLAAIRTVADYFFSDDFMFP